MIASLHEGTFSVGPNRKFIPVDPGKTPKRGHLKLAVNPFLIRYNNFIALIDAGLGPFGPFDHYDLMVKNLQKHDLTTEDVRHIYCSHLHIDHIGGLLYERFGSYELTFPEATIWLSCNEWKKFRENAESKNSEEILRWAFYLEAHADLRFVEEQPPEPDLIQMETIGGHTEFHQAILYNGKNEKAMMLGDVLARPEAINHKFISKIDYDGEKSRQNRDKYLRKALDEGYYILTYHGSNGAIVTLRGYNQAKGYEIEPVESGVTGQKY